MPRRATRRLRPLTAWAALLAGVALVVASCSGGGTTARTGDAGNTPHTAHASRSVPPPAPLREGERFMSLSMEQPYTPKPPNGGTDDYRCFLIDPGLQRQAFLTGAQFMPQNADIVHHAIFFRLGPEQVESARKLDAKAPGQGWTCFGDAGVRDAGWVAHWAPGTNETLLNPKYGYSMPAGSRMVMQVHYNTLGGEGKATGSDRSGIRLRVTDATLEPLQTGLFAAQVELPCTAQESGPLCDRDAAIADVSRRFGGQSRETVEQLAKYCAGGRPQPGATQSCEQKLEGPATVHALAGHMHLLGRSIKVELNPGTAGAKTLLDVPRYNFDDQALRPLAEPAKLKAGDTLRVTCTHDASLRARLPQLNGTPPRYVVWGEGTSDEMCLGLVIMSR